MQRIAFLILVGAVTFVVVLFLKRPELFEEFEAWLAGLVLPLTMLLKRIWQYGLSFLQTMEERLFPRNQEES